MTKTLALLPLLALPALAQRQMDPLERGVVAVRTGGGSTYVGWRMLGSDESDVAFNLYRSANGGAPVKLNATPLAATTDFQDNPGSGLLDSSSLAYHVRPVIDGAEQAASASFTLPAGSPQRRYLSVPFTDDPGPDGPYDTKFAWVGDFDGDGEYDLLCDRLSTQGANEQFLEAYLQDGTFLWRMHMGPNSLDQANAYVPGSSTISIGDCDNVTCFDLDGDGRAEAIVRTADGVTVTDSTGAEVASISGPTANTQFLTVIDGMTGQERDRIEIPNDFIQYGPYNSRIFIAYLDGKTPSIVLVSNNRDGSGPFYRQWTAFDFVNGSLAQRWVWEQPPGVPGAEGHQIRIADVDNDGRDEIIDIGHVMDDDGTRLYVTELTHGDRFHVADINPDWPGLETYAIQQNNPTFLATAYMATESGDFHRKWYSDQLVDVGRGLTADIAPAHRGLEMFSTQPNIYNAYGEAIYSNHPFPYEGLWWDGDLGREFVAGSNGAGTSTIIDKFNPNTGGNSRLDSLYNEGVHSAYGGRPAFWGDILGDWREELVLVANDYSELRIYTTTTPAQDRRRTLMHNAQYRVQTTTKGYVQASYVDYYLGFGPSEDPPPPIADSDHTWVSGPAFDATTCPPGESILFDLSGDNSSPVALSGTLSPSKLKVFSSIDYHFDGSSGSFTGTMRLVKSGSGSMRIDGSHDFSGPSEVWDGALLVDGELSATPLTVHGGTWGGPLAGGETGGRLGGAGTVAQAVTLAWRGAIAPGDGNGDAATLSVGSLHCGEDSLLSLDLSNSAASDLVDIAGDLTLEGPTTLVIHPLEATLEPGTHTLLRYGGSLIGSLDDLQVVLPAGTPYELADATGEITLTIPVTRDPADLVWQGGSNGNAWDLLDTANFLREGSPDTFVAGDSVTFDDSGAPHTTVDLVGDLPVADVTVDNSLDYRFTGSGSISGSGGLSKSGSGTLEIDGLHDFTGPVRIDGGRVEVEHLGDAGQPSSLGAAGASATNLVLDGGALRLVGPQANSNRGLRLESGGGTLDTPDESLQISGSLFGPGTLTKQGDGILILAADNHHAGGTVIGDGTLQLATDTANIGGLGSGPTTFLGGTLSMTDGRSVSSWHSVTYHLIVPAGESGRLNADGRCNLEGSLTGAGEFTFYTPFVRTALRADWSDFAGRLNVVTDGDGGDLRIDAAHGFGSAHVDLAEGVYAYYLPDMGSNLTLDVGALSGEAGATLLGGPTGGRTLTWRIGARNLDTTYAGSVEESGSATALSKVGDGVLTLTGTLNHGGSTLVSGGVLRLDGTSTASDFTVANGGTFGGSGTLGGDLALQNGGGLELSDSPLAIDGNLSATGTIAVRPLADPGPGTHVIATYTGSFSGSPNFTWSAPYPYAATFSTVGGQLSVTLSNAVTDSDGDLMDDFWELSYFPDLASCRPLDDPDADGVNNWLEWKGGTNPLLAASLPDGGSASLTTADGEGFDGALCEVNYSGVYDGGFYTEDLSRYRNNCYQNNGVRHYLTVLKFDLRPWAGSAYAEGSLQLVVNSATGSSHPRNLARFTGDPDAVTPSIGYNAANPFIADTYPAGGETDTDTDFAAGTVEELLGYTNGVAGETEVIGAGDPALREAINDALLGDGFLTLLIHGGSGQYLTQADEDPNAANRPTLSFSRPPLPDADTDNNGLADAWEAQYFGALGIDPDGDSDADGSPEWLEQALGLDPQDPSEHFRARLADQPDGELQLTWPNGPGVRFTVESSTTLQAPWSVETTIDGATTPPELSFPIPLDQAAEFYRIGAEASP